MTALLMEKDHFEIGISPVADFAGADPTYSDVVNMRDHETVRFLVAMGVHTAGTGTVKFTVNACDDVVPTNETAVPFRYRVTVAGANPGAITATTASTGVTCAVTDHQIIEIEVLAEDVGATGKSYVRLKNDEVVNDPIVGAVLIQMGNPKHAGASAGTATV